MSKKIKNIISKREFNYLNSFTYTSLTPDEKIKLKEYEKEHKQKVSEITKAYFDKIKEPTEKGEYKVNYDGLLKAFLTRFKEIENKTFDKDQIENLKTVLYYFAKDERFFKCKNLQTKYKPDFNKGILIIGGYGNGKSTTFRVLKSLFQNTPLIFKNYTATQIVDKYEAIKEITDKDTFKRLTERGTAYFDDVKTERMANNFGKRNLFKDIIEERYNNKAKTYISCNYSDKPNEQNIEAGLNEFYDKYGARVYDRLFEMFNIVEFIGKSLR
jgi:DNA replication protein DnaC